MVDVRIVQEWVDKAGEDFAFALVNLQEEKPFFSQICFQSAEIVKQWVERRRPSSGSG